MWATLPLPRMLDYILQIKINFTKCQTKTLYTRTDFANMFL